MAEARIEHWPGGPEGRAYTADGRVNRPPGWQPPAPEDRERISALIRERARQQQAAASRQRVRDTLAARDPQYAQTIERAVRDLSPRSRAGRSR